MALALARPGRDLIDATDPSRQLCSFSLSAEFKTQGCRARAAAMGVREAFRAASDRSLGPRNKDVVERFLDGLASRRSSLMLALGK